MNMAATGLYPDGSRGPGWNTSTIRPPRRINFSVRYGKSWITI